MTDNTRTPAPVDHAALAEKIEALAARTVLPDQDCTKDASELRDIAVALRVHPAGGVSDLATRLYEEYGKHEDPLKCLEAWEEMLRAAGIGAGVVDRNTVLQAVRQSMPSGDGFWKLCDQVTDRIMTALAAAPSHEQGQ